MECKGLNPNNITVDAGLSVGLIGKAIKNSAGLNSDTIEKILHSYIDLNPIWFVLGEGEMLKPNIKDMSQFENVTKTVTFSEETKSKENVSLLLKEVSSPLYSKMPKIVTVNESGKDNVVLVPAKAAAGYLLGYGDPQFVQTLPTFSLPNIQNGTFRMFQVSGHSMYPTLNDGSYVVGEWVENWIKDIKDNRIYVIVSNDGILVKRVLNRLKKYDNLYLKSDNRKEYPNISLETYHIKEVWAVKMHLSFELPDPTVLYDRVGDLEAEIDHIKSLLKSKN
ncbi:S24 family peptidase [Flavobacterium laiguense]|nr:S24/S26 family peptidase [Flavobacterium laiguense]